MNVIKKIPRRLRAAHAAGSAYVDRALQDVLHFGRHEVDVIAGHWSEVGERLAVARHARDVFELIRDQIDLFPETRARLGRNRRRRRAMLHGLLGNLAGRPVQAA